MDGAAPARPVRPRSLLRVDKVEVDLLSPRPRSPLSPSVSLALCFHRNGGTLARASPRHCRSSRPPFPNRRDQKVRQDLLYHLAEARSLGRRHLVVIVILPHRHRTVFIVDSGRLEPSSTSTTTQTSPW